MDEIAVLIPCYNEGQTIAKVVADYRKALSQAKIYVYDNNSTDDTAAKAKAAGAIVRTERRQGKGQVIRTMFRDIDARCYIITDGDDTYPADHAREMANLVLFQGSDMVVGDRLSSTYFTENNRPFHNVGNKTVKGLINFLFQNNIRDIMTGYRAFSYTFVKTFPVLSKGFEIETEMTIHALDKNLQVDNIIVTYRDRPQGSQSKLNTYSDGARVLRTIFRLYKNYRPMPFFGVLALILACISTGFFVPILISFFLTNTVEKIPTLIVCGFLYLIAIHAFFSGLILDVIRQRDRQRFELDLNLAADRCRALQRNDEQGGKLSDETNEIQ